MIKQETFITPLSRELLDFLKDYARRRGLDLNDRSNIVEFEEKFQRVTFTQYTDENHEAFLNVYGTYFDVSQENDEHDNDDGSCETLLSNVVKDWSGEILLSIPVF